MYIYIYILWQEKKSNPLTFERQMSQDGPSKIPHPQIKSLQIKDKSFNLNTS